MGSERLRGIVERALDAEHYDGWCRMSPYGARGLDDGLAVARAVAEDLLDNIPMSRKIRALFRARYGLDEDVEPERISIVEALKELTPGIWRCPECRQPSGKGVVECSERNCVALRKMAKEDRP